MTDAVEDGISGLLTTRTELVSRTVELLGDPERIIRLGRQAQARAFSRFEIRSVALNLLTEQLR